MLFRSIHGSLIVVFLCCIGGMAVRPTIKGAFERVTASGQTLDGVVGPSCSIVSLSGEKSALFVIGGRRSVPFWSSKIFRFNTEEHTWAEMHMQGEEEFSPRNVHTATVVNNKIYIIGGRANYFVWLEDTWELDVSTGRLTQVPVTGDTIARGRHSAALYDNKIWVYGGESRNVMIDTMSVLDLQTKEWSTVETNGVTPGVRVGHSTEVYGDHLYLFGGHDSASRYNTSIWSFSFKSKNWEIVTAEAMPERAGHSSTLVGSNVWLFGGHKDSEKLASVDVFDLKEKQWYTPRLKGHIPRARQSHCAALDPKTNGIYIAAGAEGWFTMFNDVHLLHTDAASFDNMDYAPAISKPSSWKPKLPSWGGSSGSSGTRDDTAVVPVYERSLVADILARFGRLRDRWQDHASADPVSPAEANIQQLLGDSIPPISEFDKKIQICKEMEPKLRTLAETRDTWVSSRNEANDIFRDLEAVRLSKKTTYGGLTQKIEKLQELADKLRQGSDDMQNEEATGREYSRKKMEHQDSMKRLENKILDLKRRTTDKARSIAHETSKLASLSALVSTASDGAADAEKHVSRYGADKASYGEEVKRLQEELKQHEQHILKLESGRDSDNRYQLENEREALLKILQDQDNVRKEQNAALDQFAKFAEREREFLTASLKVLKDDKDTGLAKEPCESMRSNTWEKYVQKITTRLDEIAKELDKLDREHEAYDNNIMSLKTKKETLESTLRAAKENLAHATRRLEDANRDLDNYRDRHGKRTAERVTVEELLDQERTAKRAYDDQINTLQSEINDGREAWVKIEDQHMKWENSRLERQKALSELRRQVELSLDSLGEQLDAQDSDRNSITDLGRRISAVETSAKNAHGTFKRGYSGLDSLRGRLLDGCGDVAGCQRQNAALQQEVDSLKKQLQAMEKEKTALTKQRDNLGEENSSLLKKIGRGATKAAAAVREGIEKIKHKLDDDQPEVEEVEEVEDEEEEKVQRRQYKPPSGSEGTEDADEL